MTVYDYPCALRRVVDGDTVDVTAYSTVNIDAGFRVKVSQQITMTPRVRLAVIDTPERGEAGYKEATEFLRAWCMGRTLRVRSYLEEARGGRWVADLYDADGTTASEALLLAGLAKVWE